MAQKDLFQRLFMSRPDMFADVCNVFLPWSAIKADQLVSLDPNVVFKGHDRKLRIALRDTLKCWTPEDATLAILGVESQSAVDWNMVVRVLFYDALSFRSQLETKKGKLSPVVTFVVYYGEKPWTGPKTLKESIEFTDITRKLFLPLTPDVSLNILDFHAIEFEKIEKMTSDFRFVATFLYNAAHPNDLHVLPPVHDPELIRDFLKIFHGKKRGSRYPKIKISNERLAQGGIGMNELLNSYVDYQVQVAVAEATDKVRAETRNELRDEVRAEVRAEVRDEVRDEVRAEERAEGRAEGLAEGRAEGRAEERAEIQKRLAKKLALKGWTNEEIADHLEVEVTKVETWLAED